MVRNIRGLGDDLRETHGIRVVFQSPQTAWEVGRGIEEEVREPGSADRPILALRRQQPALTDSGGRVCEPTVPCTEGSKNHSDGNYITDEKIDGAAVVKEKSERT